MITAIVVSPIITTTAYRAAIAVDTAPSSDGGTESAASGFCFLIIRLTSTLTGAVAGNNITDPEALILDAAFPAVFAALLAPQLSGRSARYAAIAEGTIAGLTVPILPAGLPIVAAVVAGLTATLAPADGLSDS